MLLAVSLLPANVSGQDAERVAVRGMADLDLGRAAAEERALAQAFRMAVEQVAGVIIESETLVQNFALVDDQILTRTEGYVTDYNVLFDREEDGLLVLQVEVWVAPGRLEDDLRSLGILLRRANYPTVSVEVFASSEDELPPDAGIRYETAAASVLTGRGLEVVTPGRSGLEPTVRIEGTIEISDQGNAAGLRSAAASGSFQAVEVMTGRALAATSARANGAGVSDAAARDQAVDRLFDNGLDELLGELVDAWSDRVNNRDQVIVTIRGISALADVETILDEVSGGFGETRDITQRTVSVDRGTAVLDWRGRSDARALASWLDRHDFGRFDVQVVGIGGNMVQLEIRTP